VLRLFGPFPRSSQGNEYLIVGVEHFSRWPLAMACQKADAAIAAMYFVLLVHGDIYSLKMGVLSVNTLKNILFLVCEIIK
jgi:hypothetical protein